MHVSVDFKYLFLVLISMLVSLNATPQVTADFTTITSASGCGSLVVEFQDLSLGGPTGWLWDFGNGNTSTLENPIAVYNSPGVYDVILKVSDGVIDDTKTVSSLIVVYEVPYPVIHVNSGFEGCLPLTSSFVDISNANLSIVSWQWDFGDGGSSNVQNPDHIYLTHGLYSVSLSVLDTNGCENLVSAFDLIEVRNPPVADFSVDITFSCDSIELISFSNSSLFSSEFIWEFGDGSTSNVIQPTHSFSSGLYTVTLLAKEGGCLDTLVAEDMITIIGSNSTEFTVNANSGCEGLSVSFSDITDGYPNTFFWDFGDGNTSILQNPTHTFYHEGVYDIKLTTSHLGQCISSKTTYSAVEVFPSPAVAFEADTTLGCYTPFNIVFTNSTINGGSWIWDFGDGNYSNLENPVNNYANSGEFNISLFVENSFGCVASDTFVNYINIYETPDINFSASPIIACAGVDISFLDMSLDAPNNWQWNFGNGYSDTVQNPIYQYPSTGIFDIRLIAGVNTCKDTLVFPNYIKIIEPTAIFEEIYSCDNPFKVEFHNLSLGSDSVFWDFGDGITSSLENPIHTFLNLGIHTVSLSISNSITGCTHTINKEVELTQPIAQFDYLVNGTNSLNDSVGCPPKRVYLDNQSQDYSYYRVLWSDGHIGHSRIDHLFTEAGLFDVTMIVVDIHGCKDTATIEDMYHIYDVNIDFGILNTSGCDSILVEFEDLSNHPFASLTWDFGDGGTSSVANPHHTYITEGVYDVTLYTRSVYGCKDTLRRSDYITFERPLASFSANHQNFCKGDLVSFSNSSVGYGVNYLWDFGDGNFSTELNPDHEYFYNGSYDVTLTVTDSFTCSNTLYFADYINVLSPIANFTLSPLSSNCPPLIADFANLSSFDANLFEWRFGDGSSSLIENPTHLFDTTGLYDVCLIVENSFGCTDTLFQYDFVDVSGLIPTGSFAVSDTLVCMDDTVNFLPNVINAEHFLWDFGNGTISTDSFPHVIYGDTGVYIPTLIIENNTGCQININTFDTLRVNQVIVDAGLDLEICEGEFVELGAVGNGYFFNWTPAISLSATDISNPITNPNIDILYYVHSTDGLCSAIDSVFIMVHNDVPQPTFSTINQCEGEVTSFLANSGLNTVNNSFSWSFGQNGQTVSFPLNLGSNSVFLVVENLNNSCKDSIEQEVIIFPNPIADFVFSSNEICLGDTVAFINNTSNNTVSWSYNFGDSVGVAINPSPVHMYINSGVFNVVLDIISDMGCSASIIKDVVVHELPIVDFLVEENCEDVGNVFVDLSSVIDGYIASSEYNFNDGFISTDSIVTHIFDGYGLFDVTLEVISAVGCSNSSVKRVEVFPNPISNFSALQFCEGDSTIFHNLSFIYNSKIISYEWNFGLDGYSSEKNPIHIFSSSGIYDASLLVKSDQGCKSKLTKKVEIYSLPSAAFDIATDVCMGERAEIFYVLDINSSKVVRWNYNFGDGYSSEQRNPTHFYNHLGSFDVGLEVFSSDGCKSDTIFHDIIEVHALPFADFKVSSFLESELNSDIGFFNHSVGAEFFKWDFDDGNHSFEQNPNHSFEFPRIYNVSLHAINQFGCSSVAHKAIQIDPEYTFFVPSAFSPDGDGLNDIFRPKGNRVLSYNIQVFDRWGGLVFESSDINLGWNGTNAKGMRLDDGIYLYHIEVYDLNNRLWIYNGEFSLMR